ncbi:hypothetical protein MKX01_022254 [Papaver californicum]|nr:hypothetical protein MKX01_022254 [Papaver californicum]
MSELIEVDDQPPPSFSQNKLSTLVYLKLKVVTLICGSVEKCYAVWRKIFNPDLLPRFIRGGTETTRIYHFGLEKNVFFYRGRFICGPDPRGFLLTAFSISLSSWIFCTYIANDSSSFKHSSFITIFAVFLTVLINLITVSTTDPGIIPRNSSLSSLNDTQMRRIKSMKLVINGVEVKIKFCRIVEFTDRREAPTVPYVITVSRNSITIRNYRFYLMFTTSALIFFIYIFAFSCHKINRRISETRLGFFRTISNCPLPSSRVDFRAEATSQMCHGGAGQLQL